MPLQASPAGLLGRFAPSTLHARILGRFAPSGFALRARNLGRFTPLHFALRAHKNFQKKKSLSQSTQNGLQRIEMQKKIVLPP